MKLLPRVVGRSVSLLFQEIYDEVADLLETLHHHEMARPFYDFQPPVADPLRDAAATDPLGTRVHRLRRAWTIAGGRRGPDAQASQSGE